MDKNTSTANKKSDKKLSIYLSTQRLALLTGFAGTKSIPLTQALYELIDTLEEPKLGLESMQADIRQLQSMVHDSINSTRKLTATFTLAIEGEPPSPPEPEKESAFGLWLREALAGTHDNTIAAIVVPTLATASGVRLTTRSLKVGDRLPAVPKTELLLSHEEAGAALYQAAKSNSATPFALVGRREHGTDWIFRILGKDASGRLSQQIHSFKHPS